MAVKCFLLMNIGSFNLNLLECKYQQISKIIKLLKVLISTYWNVNGENINNFAVETDSFNLNLLECKS